MAAEPVRLVVWDLDDTFWKGTVTEGGIQDYVQAHHDIVVELARRGILSSICSKNDKATILAILEEKGIRDYFVFPSISWEPKGVRLARLVEAVQLRAPTIMFIDDNASNRGEAAASVPGLQVEDETFIPKMLDDPRFKGKEDHQLTRLNQYKLLEQRKLDEAEAPGGNEAFLRGSNIRVSIEYDIESHIDRAVELINRTNQLNYTKRRLPEDAEAARQELRVALKPFDRVCGLIRVVDKYGDYGFVGLFMTGGIRTIFQEGAVNTQMIHFCFSCRTLGMFIEQWVYQYLGQPELNVVGEVLTDLTIPRTIDWVMLAESSDLTAPSHPKIAPQIVVYGGCEANVFGVYFKLYTEKVDVFSNYMANGIFVNVNFAARLTNVCDRNVDAFRAEAATIGLPLHLESGDILSTAAEGTLFVVNFTADAHGQRPLRHKVHDWIMVLSADDFGGGVKLPLSEQEIATRLAARKKPLAPERLHHLVQINQHVLENYEVTDKPSESAVIEEAREVIARIPAGSKLIIIVDHDETVIPETPGEMKKLPWVKSYRVALERMAANYPYVGVMPLSNVIQSQNEIRGSSHYNREVYYRLVEGIVGLAESIVPRADMPVSKQRRTRLAAVQRNEQNRMEEAWTLVQAGFQTLLRRPADPKSGEYFASALGGCRLTPADFLQALAGTNEFKNKWLVPGSAEPKTGVVTPKISVAADTRINHRVLRVPDDLTRNPMHPKRVLIIGSCLSEGWANRMRVLPEPCESDLYLLGGDLPDQPPHSIGQYDFQIVQLALRFVLPDGWFARLGQADVKGHEKLFAHAVHGMRLFLEGAMRWNREHGILTFVFPFTIPLQNAVGRLMPRYDLRNPVFFIEKLNETLDAELHIYQNTYFFDLNEINASHGKQYIQDDSYLSLNHGGYVGNFDFDFDQSRLEVAEKATDIFEVRILEVFTAAWRELVSLYRSVRQVDVIKMVVVDLDDTLWRGVMGEVDADSMPTSEGWPKGFWEALLFLKRRGILLAIISKNEETRVVEAWDKLVARQLKLDDFAIRRINWRSKPENMTEILAHVNLLPGNVLYIDDNPAERAAMKGAFPDIRVLGGTPLTWRRILLWSSETQVPTITPESGARTDMVRAQVVREEQRAALSREDFLASLGVRMTPLEIQNADHPRFPRVFELINKTNQFNTTGKRWTREECVAAFATGTAFYAFEVADLYTEYGLVGVLIVDAAGIRQFVMSCRIMGLEAEIAAVSYVGVLLRSSGILLMFAAMVETDRNQPCRDLYSRCGFEAVEGGWSRSLSSWFDVPAHIALQNAVHPGGKIAAAAE